MFIRLLTGLIRLFNPLGLFCMYLAHHELESDFVNIIIINSLGHVAMLGVPPCSSSTFF